MELYIVSTPIGNMGDITTRAKETLEQVDCVLCEDTRVCAKLFMLLCITKKPPMFSYHKFNEQSMCARLEELFGKYKKIALVSDAGTPAISDPGAILVNKARSIGAQIIAIPGASAAITAASLSGCVHTDFVFLGFFPKVKIDQKKMISKMENSGFLHYVFFESPNKIISTLEVLQLHFCDNAIAVVFNDLTKKFERQYIGTLKQVIEELKENEKSSFGEYVISLQLKILAKENKDEQSMAALLVDYVIKNETSIKQAVEDLGQKGLSKNVLKQTAIELKNIFSR